MFVDGAILLIRDGRRFTVERDKPNFAFGNQPGKQAFIVFDDEVAKKFSKWPYFISTAPGGAYAYFQDYKRTRPDLYAKGTTPAELATAIGQNGRASCRKRVLQ